MKSILHRCRTAGTSSNVPINGPTSPVGSNTTSSERPRSAKDTASAACARAAAAASPNPMICRSLSCSAATAGSALSTSVSGFQSRRADSVRSSAKESKSGPTPNAGSPAPTMVGTVSGLLTTTTSWPRARNAQRHHRAQMARCVPHCDQNSQLRLQSQVHGRVRRRESCAQHPAARSEIAPAVVDEDTAGRIERRWIRAPATNVVLIQRLVDAIDAMARPCRWCTSAPRTSTGSRKPTGVGAWTSRPDPPRPESAYGSTKLAATECLTGSTPPCID